MTVADVYLSGKPEEATHRVKQWAATIANEIAWQLIRAIRVAKGLLMLEQSFRIAPGWRATRK